VDRPGWSEVRAALTNAGWSLESAPDAKLAERIARDLELDAVIGGEYTRASGEWALRIQVYRLGLSNQPGTLEMEGASLNDLLLRAASAVAERLGTKVPSDDVERWRKRDWGSNEALGCMAEYSTLQRQTAPLTDQEKMLRQALAEDPRYLPARIALAEMLLEAQRTAEAETERRAILDQAPDLCDGHLALIPLLVERDPKAAERELHEALRVHPGCPSACDAFFYMWHDTNHTNRWQELRTILEKANTDLPDQNSTRAYLAVARIRCGDGEGSEQLLREIGDAARYQSEVLHETLLTAAVENVLLWNVVREVRWFQQHAAKDTWAAHVVADVNSTSPWATLPGASCDPPRTLPVEPLT
jgi:tetratricopeptide (TPR) repeat protein